MRWNASPSTMTGALTAVPVTLLSRDEDSHHPGHIHHARHAETHSAPITFGRRSLPIKPARIPVSSIVPPRPSIASSSETIRLNSTFMNSQQTLDKAATERPEQNYVGEVTHDRFIICSGRSLTGDSPRSNNVNDEDGGHVVPKLSLSSLPPHPVAATETPRSQRGLQRTDSELELIINELREKVALRQRTIQSSLPGDDENSTRTNQHARKHLKNPVEKMSLTSSSSNLLQLRRQVSASQAMASRLVSEGSASMVIPVVLSSSASRGVLPSSGHAATHPQHVHTRSDIRDGEPPASHSNEEDGFRIRSYPSTETSTYTHPQFTSSTSLGQNLPMNSHLLSRQVAVETPSVQRKPRVRTLVDLELELEQDGDDSDGSTSPVGPWPIDHDGSSALSSSRSTSSLSSAGSTVTLPVEGPESSGLSPRSRLLWLSDCCCDEAWGVPSVRVMEMLRPGGQRSMQIDRPASALEPRRRTSKSKSGTTPGKPRATSAKLVSATKRASSDAPVASASDSMKIVVPKAQRPRSGTGSGSGASLRRGSSFRT